jgi:hypothetical protein
MSLTNDQVARLRERHAAGATAADLAAEHGLSVGYTEQLVRGTQRPDAGGPIAEHGGGHSRWSDAAIRELRGHYANGVPLRALAAEFGMSWPFAYQIVRGAVRQSAGGHIRMLGDPRVV